MPTSFMRFLVFQHIGCEHPGIFRNLMKEGGVNWDTIEFDQGDSVPSFEGYDALLVMGGPMDVWQKKEYPWLALEIQAISHWVLAGKPYLGFCLGHQLLAEALGGEVGPATEPEIGIMPVNLTKSGADHWLFENCPATLMSLQWHSAEVIEVPERAEVLADSPACKVNAMSWGEYAASVQFHVELTDQTVMEWGKVPAYAAALDAALGPGALVRMNQTASEHMSAFNRLSKTLYENFIRRLQEN